MQDKYLNLPAESSGGESAGDSSMTVSQSTSLRAPARAASFPLYCIHTMSE